jgi:hypothetical protein
VGTHVLNITHELNSSKNVGTHVLTFTHEHLSVSCSEGFKNNNIAQEVFATISRDENERGEENQIRKHKHKPYTKGAPSIDLI